MIRISGLLCALALCCLPAARGADAQTLAGGRLTEVVVTLASPPLAGRTGAAGRAARAAVDREQARFAAALHQAVPGGAIRWRYRLVLNGAAVVIPAGAIPRLWTLPGVRAVDVGAAYASTATTASNSASAAATWQTGLPNRGAGMKIGIIDDGVDQRHPYFSPAGYTMPPGFPKGQAAFTTAKVIVARAFAPAGTTWKYARTPFDPVQSGHGTHVAGIAAGNAGTTAAGGATVSGIAPRAYIGNYKALTVPTDKFGIDGNAAEIVAAIEAAVADGMDVINLSIGEPEVEPSRDLVALALDGAARAGVVPVVAAGNDFDDFGRGLTVLAGDVRPGDHRCRRQERQGGHGQSRELQQRGADASLASAQAGHQRARRRHPLVRSRRLGGVVGHVHGEPADRRRRGAAARAAPVLVRRDAQGSADRLREPRRRRQPGRRSDAWRWRAGGSGEGRRPARSRHTRRRLASASCTRAAPCPRTST